MSKTSKGKWGIVNGVNTKIEITENEFPEELKELVSKKRVLIEKRTKEIKDKHDKEIADQYLNGEYVEELKELEKNFWDNMTEEEYKEMSLKTPTKIKNYE